MRLLPGLQQRRLGRPLALRSFNRWVCSTERARNARNRPDQGCSARGHSKSGRYQVCDVTYSGTFLRIVTAQCRRNSAQIVEGGFVPAQMIVMLKSPRQATISSTPSKPACVPLLINRPHRSAARPAILRRLPRACSRLSYAWCSMTTCEHRRGFFRVTL